MCQDHQTTLNVINDYLNKGNQFSYDELKDSVIESNGVFRTSLGVTVRMYLQQLQAIGLLVFEPTTGKYSVHKEVLKDQALLAV